MQAHAVHDVGENDFEEAVIRRSATVPVVVDFWAPWCGPCRALGPLLERLAGEALGAWDLVKVNVDENQALSARYGVQGIPAVKGFRDGAPVAEFVGAQGERAVRAFLQRLVPSPADMAAADGERAAARGDMVAAEAAFRRALAEQPDQRRALLGLGKLLMERGGEEEQAERLLAEIPAASPEGAEAAGLLARLRFARAVTVPLGGPSPTEGDALAQSWHAGMAAAAAGRYAEALDHLIAVVERNRRYRDGAAQAAMRDIFAIVGEDDPLTGEYRRRLSRAVFA